MLLIDELSEFFRSKPDARALNEDARTLQLFGELTGSTPVWIVAAVQESIERTGDISQVTFRKIKDRFPVKFALSTLHIKALISGRLVKRKPGADEKLQGIYEYYRSHFPSFKWSLQDFQATYPVHPETISLLDGLGDLFSVHRGIVDFVHSRLAGDKSRRISGILERPAYELLGPDSIYDHFSTRMAEFSAFHVYPRHVVPHLDEVIKSTIENSSDRDLARRIVRILVLYKIHPTASVPVAKELTELVACALSDQDPDLNVQFVAEAILDPLVDKSRFLVKKKSETGDPLDDVYTVVTEEDPSKTLKAKLLRAASEIPFDDTRLLTKPFSEISGSLSWPGPGLLQGYSHSVTWRHSSRHLLVSFINPGEEDILKDRIGRSLLSADIDFAVVISLGKTDFQMEHTAVWEVPLPLDKENGSILREYLAAQDFSSGLRPSNPADAGLVQPALEAVQKLKPSAHNAALRAFYSGKFTDMNISVEPATLKIERFDGLLEAAGDFILESRYPGFKEIAPRKVLSSPVLFQRIIDGFVSPGRLSLTEARSRGLSDAIEGLAMPLGLVELRAGSYIFAPDPENHRLLSELFGLINTAGRTNLSDVMLSLRTGRFGLPVDTACFLFSALAHGGLLTLIKNNRAMPLELIRLNKVQSADALAPGEVIGRHDRETLMNECAFLSPKNGWESFGLRQQREAWQGVVKFRDWAHQVVIDMEKRLSSVADFSAFDAFDLQSLRYKLNSLSTLSGEIRKSYHAREGLEQFLKAWRSSGFTSHDIDFIKKMRSFLTRFAEHLVFVNHYVRHTVVDRAVSEDREIEKLRNNLVQLLENPETLVMDDDTGRLNDAFDRFRTVYADYYTKKHGEHYSCFEKKPLSRFAKRAYRLLQRLASIDVLDRPAGLETLFREMDVAKGIACRRNLAEELIRSPVCSCGFFPGETTVFQRIEDPEEVIEQCLDEYLRILKGPEIREAISARIFALSDSEPDTVKRLRSLNALLEDERSSSPPLLDLLDELTAKEISRSLSGRVTIERRPLKDLVAMLGGRRLAPDQVSEMVKEWVAISDKNTVIAIEDDAEPSRTGRGPALSWWAMIHPALFKQGIYHGMGDIETSLELQFPSLELRTPLAGMDDSALAGFIRDESFHTNAVRMAWLLFSERILSGSSWPDKAEPCSRHVDPEIARGIKERLTALKRIAAFGNLLLPDRLCIRIPLSEIMVDPWTTKELRSLAFEKIQDVSKSGKEWLSALSSVQPISLSDNPVVVIFDGVSPDVWLDTIDHSRYHFNDMELSWFRLETVPKTAFAVSELFGFSQDAMEEFGSLGIPYHHIKGDEAHGLFDLLPPFPADRPVVIRVSLVDQGAHAALLRLSEMPEVVCRFIENEFPRLKDLCVKQKRRFVVTTDHGLSITRTGFSHGRGGVFERAVFRAEMGI